MHGHEQCERCGANVEPCCAGASAQDEAAASDGIDSGVDPRLFEHLFATLGGPKATVTTEALLFALVQRLGTDLDDAKVVLEAGERVGAVQRVGDGLHRLPKA